MISYLELSWINRHYLMDHSKRKTRWSNNNNRCPQI